MFANGSTRACGVGAWHTLFVLSGWVFVVASGFCEGPEAVRFDFESGDLDGWQVIEGGFDKLVCDRAVFHNTGEKYNKQGVYFVSSLERSDERPEDHFVGVLESPVFTLTGADMALLVGGGDHPETYVALCTLDDKEVFKAHGKRTEVMQRVQWRAPDLVGERVFLRIVDRHTGSWGHVTFDDFTAAGRLEPEATKAHFAKAARRRAGRELRARMGDIDLDALRHAIADLAATYPMRYPRGEEFLDTLTGYEARVAEIEHALAEADEAAIDNAATLADALRAFTHEALIANPLVSGQPLLFVVRNQYRPDHHNTATIFLTGEVNTGSFTGGAALKAIDFANGGAVTTLLESAQGAIRDPEVHFDGAKIVFSMRKNMGDDYHLYEINVDGSDLKQLTSAPGVADIDPLYLPDGDIAFSSTREPKYCMCNRHIMANLFRMAADGANIHQIGKSTLFEGHGALTPDGRILYDRWEYVDRNFGDAQGLWTVNPDGTNHAVYWGNNTWSPGGVIDARVIPATQQTLCIFGSCHDRPWGAMALLDRRRGVDGPASVIRTWPATAAALVSTGEGQDGYGFDIFKRVNPKYEDPYPLSDKYFLCSRMTGDGETMGLYLVDVFGNEILLHGEPPGCYDPMPLGPRPRPVVIPPRRNFENAEGTFYVVDVYEGTHMANVVPRAVKYLRVVESPEKRFWSPSSWGGQGVHLPAMNWHDFNNKRILGTVPVEVDGSAHFTAPADAFIYFQLLDADGRMIQSMRSGTIVQPGERTGCIGCHENRRIAPPPLRAKMPIALTRPPNKLEGWHGPPRLFNYTAEVQPVFDKHCVECHDYGKEAGGTLLLCGDRTLTFNTSYNELWRKKYIGAIGAGPAQIQPAYSWGSHASKLVDVLDKGHNDVQLDKEAFDRLVTWIDVNAPYYPRYAGAYPVHLAGRSPLNPEQIKRLAALTGVPFDKLATFNGNQGPQISFDRPELSPCLAKLADTQSAEYDEALAIIREGRDLIQERPRADMPGFQLAGPDAQRQEKYAMRREVELRNRKAIRNGERSYDE